MKKLIRLMWVILSIGAFIYLYPFIRDCGILPHGTNYTVLLSDRLYQLNKNGFELLGKITDKGWEMSPPSRPISRMFLNKTQKALYFESVEYDENMRIINEGIYKLSLDKLKAKPTLVLQTPFSINIASISPDDNKLLFIMYDPTKGQNKYQHSMLLLLDLLTGRYYELTNDYRWDNNAIWINSHQFIYSHTTLHKDSKKNILFLYDINTKNKTDMHLDGYVPGALSPDGKWLILAGNKKTILYNIYDGYIKKIRDKELYVKGAFWLPDGKGFLYSDSTLRERLNAFLLPYDPYGMYYYSLEKKRSVRLIRLHNLTAEWGLVIPSDMEIKLSDIKRSKKISSDKLSHFNMVKICKLLK